MQQELSQTSIRKFGNSLGSILPSDAIKHMNVKEGDAIFCEKLPSGELKLSPYDPIKAEIMEASREINRQYRNAFKELANR